MTGKSLRGRFHSSERGTAVCHLAPERSSGKKNRSAGEEGLLIHVSIEELKPKITHPHSIRIRVDQGHGEGRSRMFADRSLFPRSGHQLRIQSACLRRNVGMSRSSSVSAA